MVRLCGGADGLLEVEVVEEYTSANRSSMLNLRSDSAARR